MRGAPDCRAAAQTTAFVLSVEPLSATRISNRSRGHRSADSAASVSASSASRFFVAITTENEAGLKACTTFDIPSPYGFGTIVESFVMPPGAEAHEVGHDADVLKKFDGLRTTWSNSNPSSRIWTRIVCDPLE